MGEMMVRISQHSWASRRQLKLRILPLLIGQPMSAWSGRITLEMMFDWLNWKNDV
jgi:hypothetical protein